MAPAPMPHPFGRHVFFFPLEVMFAVLFVPSFLCFFA